MNEAEAAWVRDHAWTAVMRKTYASVPAVLTMCPCEYGPCGHCSAGSHENCAYDNPSNTQWAANRANVPADWITTTAEQVRWRRELADLGGRHPARRPVPMLFSRPSRSHRDTNHHLRL